MLQEKEKLPPIKGFIEVSFLDWQEYISSILFLPNCNFACPYCHNYKLIKDPDKYQTLDIEIVLKKIKKLSNWIDGVVISGGEPTLHKYLKNLLEEIRNLGLKTKLDTNGSKPEVIKNLCETNLLNMISVDLKAPLKESIYSKVVGKAIKIEKITETLRYLEKQNIKYEIRSTIWPNWHKLNELKSMFSSINNHQNWTIQALDPKIAWNKTALGPGSPYSPEEIKSLQNKFKIKKTPLSENNKNTKATPIPF